MSNDEYLKIVREVDRHHPHLLKVNTHASGVEFQLRVLPLLPSEEEWGLIHKSEGESGFTIYGTTVRVSHDAIFSRKLHRQVDIIGSGGAGCRKPGQGTHVCEPGTFAPGSPSWTVIDPHEYRPGNVWVPPQPLFDSGARPGEQTNKVAKLGFGWFCLMRGLQDWPDDVKRDADWLDEELGPEYYRLMLFVEGARHGSPDPWRDAGFGPDDRWQNAFRKSQEFLKARGIKILATIFGGGIGRDGRELWNLEQCCDMFLQAADWSVIELVEPVNEYAVNGFSDEQVRRIGRYLRHRMPAHIPMSLSSPDFAHNATSDNNEMMGESFDRLYNGDAAGANMIGIHLDRGEDTKWSDPFNYNMFYPHLLKYNGEPIGPGSSVSSTSNVMRLARDYQRTGAAGWRLYTGHASWCVFNRRLPVEYGDRDRVTHPWEHENMKSICNAWREVRKSGTVDNIDPGPGTGSGGGGGGVKPTYKGYLTAGQSLLPEQTLVSPEGRAHLHYQSDGNLVVYLDGEPIWASNTAGESTGSLQMQPDGNLVLYNKDRPIRATQTQGHPGAMVQLQDDGNFVVYDNPDGPQAGTPLWSSAGSEFFS
jgi:hypothetical protein